MFPITLEIMKNPATCLFCFLIVAVSSGCASLSKQTEPIVLVGARTTLGHFARIREANWSQMDGILEASSGDKTPAYLVTMADYDNFVLRAEFWTSEDANSGIFFRCQDPKNVTDENCYEANIFDQRPDPSYGTGAIVKVAKLSEPYPKAAGKWNTFVITANGPKLRVVLNGVTTVDISDSKFKSGAIALQWGRGTIRFRQIELWRL
jgi:hypothetical protein